MRLKEFLQAKSPSDYRSHKSPQITQNITLSTSSFITTPHVSTSNGEICAQNFECTESNYFVQLFLSEWFISQLFGLLKLDDIKKIDSVICQHQNRCKWLEQIKKVELNIILDHSKYDNENFLLLLDWIIKKGFKARELYMNLAYEGRQAFIPEKFMKLITQNSPNMKKLILKNGELADVSLQDISNNCPYLESIVIEEMNDDSSTMLKLKCHQLKYFYIANLLYLPNDSEMQTSNESFETILRNNKRLETFSASNMVADYNIFKLFGENCPSLRSVEIWHNYDEDLYPLKVPDDHIDAFTQGCRNMRSFSTNAHRFSCTKLFQCFSAYNPYLEKIDIMTNDIWADNEEYRAMECIPSYLLEVLCKGCPLLKEFSCSDVSLSTQGLSYFTSFCHQIDVINLERCTVIDDGCITVSDSISNLKRLTLAIVGMSDHCFSNIVKCFGCNLDVVRLEYCDQLTDESLRNIAENCKNLTRVVIMEEEFVNFTIEAIWQLFYACKKVNDISLIVNDECFYPQGLMEALRQRNLQ